MCLYRVKAKCVLLNYDCSPKLKKGKEYKLFCYLNILYIFKLYVIFIYEVNLNESKNNL